MTEDPATGSATGAAAALLAELTNAADRELSFRFMEGVEMGRPSLLLARLLKDSGTTSVVYVGGRCVSVRRVGLRSDPFPLAGFNRSGIVGRVVPQAQRGDPAHSSGRRASPETAVSGTFPRIPR